MPIDPRIQLAHEKFDAQNSQDPNVWITATGPKPRELALAEYLEAWVHKVAPEPSLALRLAARCQHLGRFLVPRASYPEGRVGYLSWRKDQGKYQAERAREILREVGFEDEVIDLVHAIGTKQGLKTNPDVQAMEDALCLSFLEHEFVPFSEKYDDEKVIDIVQKTWRKMSTRGQELALGLPISGRALTLVKRALGVE